MVEPENHTLALLREIRADIADMNTGLRTEIAAVEDRLNARMDKMQKRLDEMHLNGMKVLKGFIGHCTMVERAMASFDDQMTRLETPVAALEARA